jgi:hypothetical protein
MLEIANDFTEAEYAHRNDDEIDAVRKLRQPKAIARDPRIDVGPDEAENQAEHDHAEGVQQRALRKHEGGDESEHHQGEVFGRTETQRHFGERRGK